jgi:hypothetical protein
MAEGEGVVLGVRTEAEGNDVVLRFVLQTEAGERIPVEMRGRKVLGVLSDGDRVRVHTSGASLRGPDGVVRPAQIVDLSTSSVVRVAKAGCARQVLGFLGSLMLSVLAGVLSTLCVSMLTMGNLAASPISEGMGGEGEVPSPVEAAAEPSLLIPLVIGLGVAAVVFFLTFLLPRLLRRR